jgi:carboxyl-terminal processing protease
VRRKERDSQEAKARLREARLAGKDDEPAAGPASAEKRGNVPAPTKPAKTVVASRNAPLQDDGLQADERSLSAQLAAEKKAKDAKDILLQEAAHILADESVMLKSDTRLASRTMPYLPTTRIPGN